MLKIRLQRVGRKHEPVFRVVLTDSKNGPKSGKFKEILGSYDSRRSEKAEIKDERIKYWMSQGAQVSGTMHNLLVDRKVVEGKKVNVLPKKKPIVKEKTEEEKKAEQTTAEIPAEETKEEPKVEEAPKEEDKSEEPKEEVKEAPTPEEVKEENPASVSEETQKEEEPKVE